MSDLSRLSPSNLLLAIKGIGKVVGSFHAVTHRASTIEDQQSGIPDGNTILHMFGAWLFDTTTLKGYDMAKAEAYGILCRIFCAPQRRSRFLKKYLERFYEAIAEGLKSHSYTVTTIILNSPNLFALELEGVRILMPHFVCGVRKVLPVLQSGFVIFPSVVLDSLRTSAYKIIGGVMSIPNRFPEADVQTFDEQSLKIDFEIDNKAPDNGLLPTLVYLFFLND
jgi:hypothetical protein